MSLTKNIRKAKKMSFPKISAEIQLENRTKIGEVEESNSIKVKVNGK